MSQIFTDAMWRLGAAPADFVLGNVRAVLPDRVLPDARVVVRDGKIAAVDTGYGYDVDGAGLLLAPGFIDVHSDALEKDQAPRPGAELPWEFALSAFEGRCVAAGLTTIFHGAAFRDQTVTGLERSVGKAQELCEVVDAAASRSRVDHRVLHRLDIISIEAREAFAQRLQELPGGVVPLVSHEDHTPGQGQFTDSSYLEDFMVQVHHMTPQEAAEHVANLRADGEQRATVREHTLAWLRDLAQAGRIRLMGHDPDTTESVDALVERGGCIAEFPTTVAAAQRAREQGLLIVAGAPNLLRGGSHNGNVSALTLAREGLVDAIASDYLPPALLGSVVRLARESGDLAAAMALITSGPAAVAGLEDRGVLTEGRRADLTLIDDRGQWPCVIQTLTAE